MIKYVLTDGNGSYIEYKNKTYTQTRALKNAKCFES